jgi:hypothetical protein
VLTSKYTTPWTKFRVFAALNGFKVAIQDEVDPDSPSKSSDSIHASNEMTKDK